MLRIELTGRSRYNVGISMILTGSQIIEEVGQGAICIQPFDASLVNPNSYNYRLTNHLLEMEDAVIDPLIEPVSRWVIMPDSGYMLLPHRFYLASTFEIIGSDKYVPSLIGRSSLGRLGLFLQITADLGHIGTCHRWTLELTVVQPLIVYPKMRIGQVSFWATEGLDDLGGKKYRDESDSYSHYSEPQVSMPGKFRLRPDEHG